MALTNMKLGSMDSYELIEFISHGAYGIVYRALDKKTQEKVAIKTDFNLSISRSTLREINVLRFLPRHPSVVEFKEVVGDASCRTYVVMEHMDTDLKSYIKSKENAFTNGQVKTLMKQLLKGVKFLHDHNVMHRDLKPANILMNKTCDKLKICDFGLSQFGVKLGSYAPGIGTRWYKAPELLCRADEYSSAVDMWAVGCIMAELLLKRGLFTERSDIDQLCEIKSILLSGGHVDLLRQILRFGATTLTNLGYDLLKKLLAYDPNKRITAADALRHGWFSEFDSFFYREYDEYFRY